MKKKKDPTTIQASQAMALFESLQLNIRVIAEVQTDHTKKLDSIQEMVAKNTEDIEMMKSDIAFIKNELKKFVRQEEFETLEKRVILLERKVSRI